MLLTKFSKVRAEKKVLSNFILRIAAVVCLFLQPANAVEAYDGILGKNDWLFYRYEFSDVKSTESVNVSLDLIQRFNRVLSAHHINMAVIMVPLKIRIYSEHLPESLKLDDYMESSYDRMIKVLKAGGVDTVDLNTSFMSASRRSDDSPLYYRLDSHWSPTGAMLAAKAVKAEIGANPVLTKALDATSDEGFNITYGKRKRSIGRDLINLLPPGSPSFSPEQVVQVSVSRVQPLNFDLLGNRPPSGLALLGSSYSKDWTGFVDGLRYELQRDVFSMGVGADQGSWVGMESYLRDDVFQKNFPKLLLWEIPERDMRAPPSYEFRDPRYRIDDTEWLLRASAWVQPTCKPSIVTFKVAQAGLAVKTSNQMADSLNAGPTTDGDFLELSFDKPLERLDYLSARVITSGSKNVIFEASGPGVKTRRFTVNLAGDDLAHALRTPLPSNGSGFTKVKILPGITNKFELQNLQVCRQPDGLLQ
jgi:alginate O-acetyltransferase complex protein AlgJ